MKWKKCLNDYLQFAKTQSQEKTSKINLKNYLKKLKIILNNKNLKILKMK